MKPNDFWNCTYREASLFVKSYTKAKEAEMKNQVILFERMTDKLIKVGMSAKKPKYTRIIDDYKDLFKEEFDELVKKGNIAVMDIEDKEKFVLEMQEELRRGEGL